MDGLIKEVKDTIGNYSKDQIELISYCLMEE